MTLDELVKQLPAIGGGITAILAAVAGARKGKESAAAVSTASDVVRDAVLRLEGKVDGLREGTAEQLNELNAQVTTLAGRVDSLERSGRSPSMCDADGAIVRR